MFHEDTIRELKERIYELEQQVEGMQEDVDTLQALENCGVDNWEGYEHIGEELEEIRKERNNVN